MREINVHAIVRLNKKPKYQNPIHMKPLMVDY